MSDVESDFGLSPLARGTRFFGSATGRASRFIPAGAGNTLEAITLHQLISVYPRWRGEHAVKALRSILNAGLSPLARGTLGHIQAAADQPRFIPAGAGNTPDCCRRRPARTVYPRWRGEHKRWNAGKIPILGLSPLARGTHMRVIKDGGLVRFIPAGAGNTSPGATQLSLRSVYPRWRGEHDRQAIRRGGGNGLSPLARGTRLRQLHRQLLSRFIPAGAGNTTARPSLTSLMAVYPRWRGEHISFCACGSGSSGLSPLARGTHPTPCPD